MVRLRDDLAGSVALSELRAGFPDRDKLGELYRKWGFKGMSAELEKARECQSDLFGN